MNYTVTEAPTQPIQYIDGHKVTVFQDGVTVKLSYLSPVERIPNNDKTIMPYRGAGNQKELPYEHSKLNSKMAADHMPMGYYV